MSYQEGYQNVIKASGVKLAQARNPDATYTLTPQRNQVGNLGQRQGVLGLGGNTDRATVATGTGGVLGSLMGAGKGSSARLRNVASRGAIGAVIGAGAGMA